MDRNAEPIGLHLPSNSREDQITPVNRTDLPRTPAADVDRDDSPRGMPSKRPKGKGYFGKGGKLRPFRLLTEDFHNIRSRFFSDWSVFNQLVLASTVYVLFTNLLPGITFAGDLYVLTGESWGTIEVVLSTGLCGIIFAL